MTPYLHKRRAGYYAILEIPAALQGHFGKKRFLQSLQTRIESTAEKRLGIVISKWKSEIARVRGKRVGKTVTEESNLLWEIMEWRKAIAEETDDDTREALEGLVADKLEQLETKEGLEKATEVADIVFSRDLLLLPEIDSWLPTITHLASKTQSLMKLSATSFAKSLKSVAKINKVSIKAYLSHLRDVEQLSDKTISLRVSYIRSFLKYIDEQHDTTLTPLLSFAALGRTVGAVAKTSKQRAWIPFKPKEVSSLYSAALAKDDQPLADIIALAAYTGCRIEELGSIQSPDVSGGVIAIKEGKSAAAIRQVPLHPYLKPLVKRLIKDSDLDGFLVHGKPTKYGDRTNALGKRFGRLKTELGYSDKHVFHSIRKCVVTQLEQAGVAEGTTADIVGHEKTTMTYGLYSSGTSLKQKAEALNKVIYGGKLGKP